MVKDIFENFDEYDSSIELEELMEYAIANEELIKGDAKSGDVQASQILRDYINFTRTGDEGFLIQSIQHYMEIKQNEIDKVKEN
jgi:hypothetical protein